MFHLTTSSNGLISMVEMREKFDSKNFCELMDRDVPPLIPPYLSDQRSFSSKITAQSINLHTAKCFF